MNIKIKTQRWLSILLVVTLIFSWFPATTSAVELHVDLSTDETNNRAGDIKEAVEQSLESAKKYYENNPPNYSENNKGSHSDYWVFSALWGAGYKDLKNDFPWKDSNPWSEHTYWTIGKDKQANMANEELGIIIGSLLLGKDPYNFGARNIVEDLLDRQNDNGSFSTVWGEPWALIALDLVDAEYDQEQHIDAILAQQSASGTFGDADATGWMLTALAPYMNENEAVKSAVDKSVEWAHEKFLENDEFPGMFGPNANSTASVVMGLAAVGEDLYSEKWSKENRSLVEDLIEYQQDDGSFWWKKDTAGAVGMATEQALLAIATVVNGQSIFIDLKDYVNVIVEPDQDTDYSETLEATIEKTVAHVIEKGVTSEWEAIGIHQAGFEIPESYVVHFYEKLDDQVIDANRVKITDIERLAMSAQVINLDPRNINGLNLVEKIYNSEDNASGSDIMTSQGINGPIFALIALDSGSFIVPEDARWTREKLIEYLLGQQNDDGSWSLFGTSPSYDITAMAIIALGKHQQNHGVQDAIENAVTFLSESQGEDGGFYDPWNGGVSLETAAQVMIGLTTAGIDPLGEEFTKENGNLLSHILSFVADDGGFKHLPDDSESNGMATEQGLQALVAYQMFQNGDSGLYSFGTAEEDPNPEENEDESLMKEINTNEKVSVSKGETIVIKDSKTAVVLPADLPEGTKLSVTVPNENNVPYRDGKLELAGGWFNFEFDFNDSDAFTGTFQLTLGVNADVDLEKAHIYYFNESNGEWELVEGKKDQENHTITVEVEHFSIYGVFVKADDGEPVDPDLKDTDDGDTDPTPDNGTSPDDADGSKGSGESNVNTDEEVSEDSPSIHKSSESGEQKDADNKLPKTATNSYNLIFIGLLLLILGSVTIVIRKQRTIKTN